MSQSPEQRIISEKAVKFKIVIVAKLLGDQGRQSLRHDDLMIRRQAPNLIGRQQRATWPDNGRSHASGSAGAVQRACLGTRGKKKRI